MPCTLWEGHVEGLCLCCSTTTLLPNPSHSSWLLLGRANVLARDRPGTPSFLASTTAPPFASICIGYYHTTYVVCRSPCRRRATGETAEGFSGLPMIPHAHLPAGLWDGVRAVASEKYEQVLCYSLLAWSWTDDSAGKPLETSSPFLQSYLRSGKWDPGARTDVDRRQDYRTTPDLAMHDTPQEALA